MFDREDLRVDDFADKLPASIDDHHRSVFEIADALAGLFSVALDFDFDVLARLHERLERIGKGVEIDEFDPFDRSHLDAADVGR